MLFFITILLMEILAGAEVDLFVPSFPDLQKTFNLSPFYVESLLSINLTSHCIASLIVGNLGDRYGRKPIILIGLIIFIIGSILCVCANCYPLLLLGRLLQGIGISGPAVLSFVIIADIYSLEKQQQLMGIINGSITLAMAFAPVIGSYVNLFFNWQGNFTILLILSIICFILCIFFVPNTQVKNNVKISLNEYFSILSNKKAFYYILTICLFVQAYWIFIGVSPILYIENLKVPLNEFGLYQGSLATLFSILSFASTYLIKKYGEKKCFNFSIYCLVAFILATILIVYTEVQSPLIITSIMQLLSIGVIFPCNILYPLSLEAIPEAKGRIAALIVSGRLIITAIGLQLVGYFYKGNFTSLGITMCICSILSLWFYSKLVQEDKIFNK